MEQVPKSAEATESVPSKIYYSLATCSSSRYFYVILFILHLKIATLL